MEEGAFGRCAGCFERGGAAKEAVRIDDTKLKDLHGKIVELTDRQLFFVTQAQAMERPMIEREHETLSVAIQCALLSISRSSYYNEPKGESAGSL
jgi:hypothetical protein